MAISVGVQIGCPNWVLVGGVIFCGWFASCRAQGALLVGLAGNLVRDGH